ncbi:MAG TPA: hypothetical protein VHZ07_00740 [Bryobacteraceae bacterium]|jgi:hypothetical protein|nr:hypothetical protein [Bryobacteraceae bacterium]
MNLNLQRRVSGVYKFYKQSVALAEQALIIPRRSEMERLRAQDRYPRVDRLARWGYKIYSQHDEDGMIAEIFRRIGCESHYFIEFGVGAGLENNTLALLIQDWRGIWIEGNQEFYQKIRAGMPQTIGSGQLSLKQSFITRENIDHLISDEHPPAEIDLLSIDIDGNDFHVWDQIHCVRPRVVVIEYNPKFPPPLDYCMQYDASHCWDLTDHYGASLSFLERQFRIRGYSLVGCDVTGTNAFFVRTELAQKTFNCPFTAEFHYESARFDLVGVPSGHAPSYRTVEARVRSARSTSGALERSKT